MSQEALEWAGSSAGLIALGLAVVMFLSVERTRTNVSFAAATLVSAAAVGTVTFFVGHVDPAHPGFLARTQGIFEVAAIIAYANYLLGVGEASSLTGRRPRIIQVCGWTAIGLAGWHAIASAAWPAQRLNDYELGLGHAGALSRPGFWLFAAFFLVTAIPFGVGWSVLYLSDVDDAEARRAEAAALASVIVISATAAPPKLVPVLLAAWIATAMYGQMQYVGARAQRGVFLSRFLSPRVSELVAARGLAEPMKPHLADITVVSADLRGFTAYSEGVPSQAVVDLLADYYDAVGEVVARHGGTITNYAGDGVLILVGAPLEDPRHAATGVQLARELLVAVEPVLTRWRTRLHTLGLGVGVASGTVTVGAISAASRMEYTAIGSPVNLAARLCSAAAFGEVLIDGEAARLSEAADTESRGEIVIKGFSQPQPVYALGRA